MYLVLKLILVQGLGYETYSTKKVIKEPKEKAKAEEEMEEEQEAPVPLVTHVHNILHSIVFIHSESVLIHRSFALRGVHL